MYCITIDDGEEQRQLFYFDSDKAIRRMKEILQIEINRYIESGHEIMFPHDHISVSNLQAILNAMISEDLRYDVILSKIHVEDN